MIEWFKMKATSATNAKIAKAGPDGALVFWAVLCQHVHHGHGGRLATSLLDPETLQVQAVALLGRLSVKRINAALVRCQEARLIRVDGAECVILGYDSENMPACVRCHRPNDDHRFATCRSCREARSAKPTRGDDVATDRDRGANGREKAGSPTDSGGTATCRDKPRHVEPDRTGLLDGWMDGGSSGSVPEGRTGGPGTGSSGGDNRRAAGARAAVSRLAATKGVARG